jgi:hypothetical protein
LMDNLVAPVATEDFDELWPTQVARQFHAPARTSSRTRWSRMARACC